MFARFERPVGGAFKLDTVQGMRALAATMVAAMHIVALTATHVTKGNPSWSSLSGITQSFGHAGVDVFFVISGLIMYVVVQTSRRERPVDEVLDFVLRRAARIYPLYWIALLAGMTTLVTGIAYSGSKLARTLFLLQEPPALSVAWTLVYEVHFYAVVAVLLLFGRERRERAFLVWCGVQVAACLFAAAGLIPEIQFTRPLFAEFAFGVLVGVLVLRGVAFRPGVVSAAGAALFAASFVVSYLAPQQVAPWRVLLYGMPAAILLYGLITLEQQGRVRVPRLAVMAGDISYSLYLWHFVVVLNIGRYWACGSPSVSCGVAFAGTVTATTVFLSVLTFVLVERPMMEGARRLSRRWIGAGRAGHRTHPVEGLAEAR